MSVYQIFQVCAVLLYEFKNFVDAAKETRRSRNILTGFSGIISLDFSTSDLNWVIKTLRLKNIKQRFKQLVMHMGVTNIHQQNIFMLQILWKNWINCCRTI